MKSYQHLHVDERRNISNLFNIGISIRQIASIIERSPSTVSRELRRNSSARKTYAWRDANNRSIERRSTSRRKIRGLLTTLVSGQLKTGFSPDQIVMKNPRLRLSAQTIYDFIWRDHAQGGKLWSHLRYCGKGRHVRSYRQKRGPGKARKLRNQELSISFRLPSINERLRYGHWEIDLVEPRGRKRPLLVIIERKTRYVLAGFLKGKWSTEVARVAKELLQGLKVLSITCDNGPEFMDHQLIKKTLNCELYYAHPYKSWEKGAVENVNKLIREYFPKGTSFSRLQESKPLLACSKINSRPRRSLNKKTPDSLLKHLILNP
jgi:transposase, IS30 family